MSSFQERENLPENYNVTLIQILEVHFSRLNYILNHDNDFIVPIALGLCIQNERFISNIQ